MDVTRQYYQIADPDYYQWYHAHPGSKSFDIVKGKVVMIGDLWTRVDSNCPYDEKTFRFNPEVLERAIANPNTWIKVGKKHIRVIDFDTEYGIPMGGDYGDPITGGKDPFI